MLPYDNDGVVLITTRRKHIPYDDYSYEPRFSNRSALMHSSAVMEDSYNQHKASRKSDRKLLNNIEERLATISSPSRLYMRETPMYSRVNPSPVIIVRRHPPPGPLPRVVLPSPRTYYQPPRHRVRSASLPPRVHHYHPDYDLDFDYPTKALPFRGRLHTLGNDPLRMAKHALEDLERDLEMPSRPTRTSRTTTYTSASRTKPTARSGGRPSRRDGLTSVSVMGDELSSDRGRHLMSAQKRFELMGDADYPLDSYKSLREKTHLAKGRMDTHRNMVDRYLHVDLGPSAAVDYEVDRKYGELAYRMPQLERSLKSYTVGSARGFDDMPPKQSRSQSVPPIHLGPQPKSNFGKPKGMPMGQPLPRPAMSDARKKAREVLCKTKRDPTYYSEH